MASSSNGFQAGNPPQFSAGMFKPGHVFQRGDLPIWISDLSGNPFAPAVITYTLYRYEAGNPNPIQAGAANRRPVMAGLGEYYVSGVAGEHGQPGDWFVRWTYQETLDAPETEDIYPFKVFDTSTVDPCCTSTAKYGWD